MLFEMEQDVSERLRQAGWLLERDLAHHLAGKGQLHRCVILDYVKTSASEHSERPQGVQAFEAIFRVPKLDKLRVDDRRNSRKVAEMTTFLLSAVTPKCSATIHRLEENGAARSLPRTVQGVCSH